MVTTIFLVTSNLGGDLNSLSRVPSG